MVESYKTLGGRASAAIVEKKSEFIASAAPAVSEKEAIAFLEEIRAAHRTAAHNVYAYRLRAEARQRYSDDGEPAKTAGLPILNALVHAELVDAIIVVTRYFGGTLLGTGGLVRAYTAAAQAALAAASVCTMRRCVTIELNAEYALYEAARRVLEEGGTRIDEPVFGQEVQLRATLPAGGQEALLPRLNEVFRRQCEIKVSEPFYTPFGAQGTEGDRNGRI